AVSIPVCGNGGIARHADLSRMLDATGARFAMVGRGALADPWIFSGRRVERPEAAEFLLAYAAAMRERAGLTPHGVAARLKQLLHFWSAGDLIADARRREWLRCPDLEGRLRDVLQDLGVRRCARAHTAEEPSAPVVS